MINYITKKRLVLFAGLPVSLIFFPWIITHLTTSLNKFNFENKLILKYGNEVTATLISKRAGKASYCFITAERKKYYADLSSILIRSKLPELGEQVQILIHPEFDSCLIKNIQDSQIFSYKTELIAYLVIAWLCFIIVEFMIVVIFLDTLGKIKNE